MTEPRAYPIRPKPDDDLRFTYGLLIEVGEVLARHGYPPITSGADLVALRQALYRFLYVPEETP